MPRSGEGNTVFYGVLGRVHPLNQGYYGVLHGDPGYVYRIKTIFIANVTGENALFQLYLRSFWSPGESGDALYYNTLIAGNSTLLIEADLLVDEDHELSFIAGLGNTLTITVIGEKVDVRYL